MRGTVRCDVRSRTEAQLGAHKLEYRPELTVSWGGHVLHDHFDDHSQKCGKTGSGVYPYRPSVGAMSSDDAPLIVEMSDELPDVETA